MSTDRWIDKEDVVHICNGILLRIKRGKKRVICRDVEGPRICNTERGKSEREKQILYINAHMLTLKRRCRWTYLQGRNRDVAVEIGCVNTGRGGARDVKNWEIRTDRYTLPCVKQTASGPLPWSSAGTSAQGPLWPRQQNGGGRAVPKGGDVCLHVADSIRCIAEVNTTL